MTSYNWERGTNTTDWSSGGAQRVAAFGNGLTIIRVRFRWGFYGDTSLLTDFAGVSNNIMSWGIVTTVGNGTEAIPNARTQANDQDPPQQRWLYLETRAPVVTALSGSAGLATWRDSGSTEETSTKGQVLATGIPDGESLNLAFSWASPAEWDGSGSATIWWAWSLLYAQP
jgi:hypothetical protein